MSRPIKFRYACKDLGGEVFFYYLNLDEILNGFKGFGAMGRIEEIIGRDQFTGLHDRNGREVYEGDIVTEIWCGEERSTSIVERDAPNGGFNLRDLDGEYTEIDSNHEFNIIGNIHENPELLQ